MDVLVFYLDVGRKLLLAVLAVFAVWMAVAIVVAVPLCRAIARADAEAPVVTEDSDAEVDR